MAECRWWTWLSQAAVDWFHNNVRFHKSILFIIALVFSHSLVEKGVIQVLVVYLEDQWTDNVRLVAILSNVLDGLSEAMSLVLDAVSEKWTGRFLMVVISTVAYAVGMWLLYFSTKFYFTSKVVLLFSLAMLPIAIGIGGRDPTLYDFIRDQMIQLEEQNPQTQQKKEPNHGDIEKEPNKCPDIKKEKEEGVEQDESMMDAVQERAENCKEFWVRIGRILGSLAAFLWFEKPEWGNLFKISAIVIMVSGFLFACGLPWYNRIEHRRSASIGVFQVIRAAVRKRHLQYPSSPANFYQNQGNESVLWPRDSLFRCLRWVDKAAIVTPTRTPQEQESTKLLFPVAKVKGVKLLLAMTPLWAFLFISNLVVAAGSPFFYLQADLLNRKVGSYHIPFSYFTVTLSFSSGIATLAFGPIVKKLRKPISNTSPWKLKFGLALFCLFLSCIAAWLVETRRANLIGHNKFVEEGAVVDMSVLWLTPQFWLLGFFLGFTDDGLKNFYDTLANENRHPFLYWAFPLGTFASIAWISAYQGWLRQTVNNSRLKGYFVRVAILCFVNLFFYLWTCNLSILNTSIGRKDEGCDSIARAEERAEERVEMEKLAGLPSNPVPPTTQSSIEEIRESSSST